MTYLSKITHSLLVWGILPAFILYLNTPTTFATIILPDGFAVQTIVSGLTNPTDMSFLPSGDILVVQKGNGSHNNGVAEVLLVQDPLGTTTIHTVGNIATNPVGDAGILSLLIDPNFDHNHYLYLWYSTRGISEEWTIGGDSKYRLSRFTLDLAGDPITLQNELILLEIPRAYYHNGGAMTFDNAGNLIIATGDTWELDFNLNPSQVLNDMRGKVLRIHPTANGYTIPADNPFVTDSTIPDEIYAIGTRNPFRMVSANNGDIYFGDVGFLTWEEVNKVGLGNNYGWSNREGPCPRGERMPCPPAPAHMTDPVFYYPHPEGADCCQAGAITGLAFYEGVTFPAEYHGKLFVNDFNNRFLAVVDPAQPGEITPPYFGESIGNVTDITYYDNDLYILDISANTIRRLYYTNGVAVNELQVSPTLGSAPLPVTLTATGIVNPNHSPLIYTWDFGDGSALLATSTSTVTHTYQQDGTYMPTVWIKDDQNNQSPVTTAEVTVYSGEMPALSITNVTQPILTEFRGGDLFAYSVERANGTTGLDPNTPYTWDISLFHNAHIHPILTGEASMGDTLLIPTENHGSVQIGYTFALTMLTDNGLAIRVSEDVFPQLTEVTITADPVLETLVQINDNPRLLPHLFPAIVNVDQGVEMPAFTTHQNHFYTFQNWTPNLPLSPITTIQPPANPTTYTATYQDRGEANWQYLPVINE